METKNNRSPYWVDPHLPRMVPYLHQQEGSKESANVSTIGDDFSCVLVAMWPPPMDTKVDADGRATTTLREAYHGFMAEVAKCFDSGDLEADDNADLPNIYTYPPECLHVTVATLHRFDVPTKPEEREVMQPIYTDLFRRAAKRPNWPSKGSKLRFTVESTRIGEKAGILLWKESTGNLQKIRDCVAEEHAASYEDVVEAVGEASAKSFQIPTIIHSTFMRFGDVPKTSWEEMQGKFAEVQDKLDEIFEDCVVETDVVRLACERRPYMHIPCAEEHVFESIGLQ